MERLNKRGLIFTIDAILAILATTIILVSVYSIFNGINSDDGDELNEIVLDFLTIAEKNYYLNLTTSGDFSKVDEFLLALPNQVCGNISIYNSDEDLIGSTSKIGCSVSNDEVIISRRTFLQNSSVYFAKMEVSYV